MGITLSAVAPRHALAAARDALPDAVVAVGAALLALACAQLVAPGPGSAVMAVVLSLSLARSRLDRGRRGRWEAAVALPVVGLAATGVGLMLRDAPWVGATAFTVCMALSVWLRQFGQAARRASRLIALPFVVVLTVPHLTGAHRGPLPAALVPVIVALLALASVSVLDALARRLGLTSGSPVPRAPPEPAATSTARPSPTTRLALQMGVALGLAFAAGHAFFGRHWPWVVLTTFIVHSGNRGRLDVTYTSVLRTVGAAGGTLAAALLGMPAGTHVGVATALILAAVFLGTWLRPLNYAWWALFATLALALLQGLAGLPAGPAMLQRLAAIATGAAIGVAVAWWVLPLRSTDVLRRRLAGALAALAEALDPASEARSPERFDEALRQVELLAPAFRAASALPHRRLQEPAQWIDTLLGCRPHVPALVVGDTAPAVRRAVGTARQALREPDRLLPALIALREVLQRASESAPAPVLAPLQDA